MKDAKISLSAVIVALFGAALSLFIWFQHHSLAGALGFFVCALIVAVLLNVVLVRRQERGDNLEDREVNPVTGR